MPEGLPDPGKIWNDFITNPLVQTAGTLIVIYVVLLWLGTAYWAFRDMQARSENPILPYFASALIIFFTYFYVSITFNPDEVADNMKKYGGFIPGIRAGRPTAEYLAYVLNRITVPGAIYLAVISLIPLIALILVGADQNFPFGGTSILIVVSVGLDTVKQIESQLQQRHYEGFLR